MRTLLLLMLLAMSGVAFGHPVKVLSPPQEQDERITQEMRVMSFLGAVETEEIGQDPGHAREFLTGGIHLSEETADLVTKYALKTVYLKQDFGRKEQVRLCQDRATYLASTEALAKHFEDSGEEEERFRKELVDNFLALLNEEEEAKVFEWIDVHMRIKLTPGGRTSFGLAADIRNGTLTPETVMSRGCPE